MDPSTAKSMRFAVGLGGTYCLALFVCSWLGGSRIEVAAMGAFGGLLFIPFTLIALQRYLWEWVLAKRSPASWWMYAFSVIPLYFAVYWYKYGADRLSPWTYWVPVTVAGLLALRSRRNKAGQGMHCGDLSFLGIREEMPRALWMWRVDLAVNGFLVASLVVIPWEV